VSEETEGQDTGAEASGTGVDPAAVALALGGASREDAGAFLEKQSILADAQTRLATLQAQELAHELGLRHWSLRVRHASGLLKLGLELCAGLLLLAAVVGVCAMVWNAAHADGLVIESFSVPPDMAQRGLTGQVVAGEILDRLTEIQTATVSSRTGKSYAGGWGDDIKVEIPETGVSIGEAYRFLRRWLGHENHVSGSVWRDQGDIVISVHREDKSVTVKGPESGFEDQLRRAAEGVFNLAEPYRYAVYLTSHGREAEGVAVFRGMIADGSPSDRAWGYVGLAHTLTGSGQIDQREGVRLNREAATLDPGNITVINNLASGERGLSHLEAALQGYRAELALLGRGDNREYVADRVLVLKELVTSSVNSLLGAYDDTIFSVARIIQTGSGGSYTNLSSTLARTEIAAHDLAAARTITLDSAREHLSPAVIQANQLLLRETIATEEENWRDVLATAASIMSRLKSYPAMRQGFLVDQVPLQAYAEARLGNLAEAEVLMASMPPDCDFCMVQRARIADLRGQHARADWWFSRAVADAPSIPLVYATWGQALLARGDSDRAIVQFRIANQKGPHFADPLEGWGEALMAKNQSHLALAKFAQAEKYAPNWGRLHLKWGEALGYTGKKDEAKVQLAQAAQLDLAAGDKSELMSFSAKEGGP
jgi:tetratricopeptide (TPR) repeat protein